MIAPHFTATEERTRATFLALMWAMSHPGRLQNLPTGHDHNPFALIAEALLDLEVTYFVPDTISNTVSGTANSVLTDTLRRTSARFAPLDQAAYIFWQAVQDDDITQLATASVGTMLSPDTAATLIIGASGVGDHFVLTGPGIQAEEKVQIGGLPRTFWDMRMRVSRYPVGWDVILVTDNAVIAIPRSTQVKQV